MPVIVPMGLLKQDANGTLKSAIAINGAQVLPLAGMSNIATVLCNESGRYVIFDSDQYGFHNPNEIWDSRQFDIAAVGDSYTQGYCVPSDKNFVALVRQHYPSTLNLGVAGVDRPQSSAISEFFKQIVRVWLQYREFRARLAELSRLSDHELKDIGLYRDDIARIAFEQAERRTATFAPSRPATHEGKRREALVGEASR